MEKFSRLEELDKGIRSPRIYSFSVVKSCPAYAARLSTAAISRESAQVDEGQR